MPRLLFTRPESDNDYWAKLLQTYGIETVSSPLLHIQPLTVVFNPAAYSGIILTSRHAVTPALDCRALPAHVIGQATANFAVERGFTQITTIAQTAQELLPMIPDSESGKPLLYASGENISVDVVQELQKRGISAVREVVYQAVAAENLSEEAYNGLKNGSIDGVALFSLRTAEIFRKLTPSHDVSLFCFSLAIAESCAAAGQWRGVRYPALPRADAFEECIAKHYRN